MRTPPPKLRKNDITLSNVEGLSPFLRNTSFSLMGRNPAIEEARKRTKIADDLATTALAGRIESPWGAVVVLFSTTIVHISCLQNVLKQKLPIETINARILLISRVY